MKTGVVVSHKALMKQPDGTSGTHTTCTKPQSQYSLWGNYSNMILHGASSVSDHQVHMKVSETMYSQLNFTNM
jgi:hypothetical protein